MAVIDKYAAVERAFTAAQQIKNHADFLAAQSGPINFNILRGRLDGMRESYLGGIQPLLSLGNAAAVNSVVASLYAGTLPANSYTQMQALGTALLALYTAYNDIFATLTPITHTVASGHAYANIPLVQLQTMGDELTAVVAAVTPLV
jgi:hypothetical protein